MSNQAFELAILISLRDAASGGADRVSDRLRAMGKEGRVALSTFEDLRRDMRSGLVLGGVGVAGLAMLNRGVKDAANFETALLDLKSAFQELEQNGSVNLSKLGDQMNRAERLGVDLGNKLQGTTKDYLEIFASLKKAGVDVETVLGGAGAAAGKLANVSGAITNGSFREQAKELGQFGKMFKLKPDEFEASVNLFSALRDRFDIESSSLIESSKYFLATASTLGMRGMSGASDTVKLFALLKREAGLEGSQAGTSLTSLFTMFVGHKDQLKKLGKQTGVKLELFDKKGQFLGWENTFKQAEQLRKLPAEKRMTILNKAFGEQGAKAFNAFVEAGVEGWRNVTAEAAKAVPVNDKINAQMETYNAKMEAVMGSIENLTATAFTPMLGTLKPVLDLTNNIVGSIQGFAKENPAVAGVAGHLLGIGSAALVGYAGVKTLTTGLALLRIASAVRSNESAIIGMIGGRGAAQTELQASLSQVFGGARVVVGSEIDRSGRVWGDRMRGVGSRMGGMLLTGFGVGGAFYMLDMIMEGRAQTRAAEQRAREAGERLGEMIREGMRQEIEGKLSVVALAELRKVRAEQEAKPIVESLGIPKTSAESGQFSPASEFNATLAATLGQAYYSRHYGGSLAEVWEGSRSHGGGYQGEEWIRGKLHALFLQYPEQLKAVLAESKKYYQQANEPEMFVQLKRLASETYPDLMKRIEATDGPLQQLTSASNSAAQSLFNLSRVTPLQMFPNSNVQYPSSTVNRGVFGKPKSNFHFEILNTPKLATGGYIEREGLVHIHSGERVVPAAQVRRDTNRVGGSGITVQGGIHLQINVPSGSAAANNPDVFAEHALKSITRAVRKQRERR